MEVLPVHHSQPALSEKIWVCRGRFVLTLPEKEMILQREKLNDQVITQQLLQKWFPHLNGFQLTMICQYKKQSKVIPSQQQLQIIYCKTNHWIVASILHS